MLHGGDLLGDDVTRAVAARASPTRHSFIAGIGGLRALAVLSVVLFHVDPAWLPGGFVGVDMFFVISGFVVAHSVTDGRVDGFRAYVVWFYRRRFLRILPALYLYVLVTVVAGTLFVPTSDVTRYVELTGAAAVFGMSNVALLWKAGEYFATASDYNIFTHTWSLGVEEQYYLLFPVFSYWLIIRRKRAAPMLAIAGLVCLLSLGAAWYFTQHWRAFAFFMLPTRLWELGIGFLLRWQGERLARSMPGGAISAVALAVLLASFLFTPEDAFPWPGALPPCFATLAMIAVVWRAPGGWLDRLLRVAPLRVLGDLSYSLYLWHWGVVVLMRWTVGLDTLALKGGALGLTLALALASYRCVERPLRSHRRLLALGPRAFFGGYAAAGVAIALACFGLLHAKPRIGLAASNDAAVWDPAFVPAESGRCPVTRTSVDFGTGWKITDRPACAGAAARRLFVIGDSHAGAYALLLHSVAGARAMPVDLYTAGGCRVIDIDDTELPAGCAAFRAKALAEVRAAARPGDVLFLPGLYTPIYRKIWDTRIAPDAGMSAQLPLDPAKIARSVALLQTLPQLTIIVEAPKPTMPTALFRCADWFDRANAYCRPGWHVPRAEVERRRARPLAALDAIQRRLPAIRLWDPLPLLCDTRFCDGYRDGKPLYYDTHHLSAAGNALLLPSFLATLDAGAPR